MLDVDAACAVGMRVFFGGVCGVKHAKLTSVGRDKIDVVTDVGENADLLALGHAHVHDGGTARLQPVEAVGRYAAVAAPIIAGGDVTGAVCLLQPESGTIPTEGDVRLAQVAAAFLGKQMEA